MKKQLLVGTITRTLPEHLGSTPPSTVEDFAVVVQGRDLEELARNILATLKGLRKPLEKYEKVEMTYTPMLDQEVYPDEPRVRNSSAAPQKPQDNEPATWDDGQLVIAA